MKKDQLYSELKLLIERLGIEISEQNFRKAGISVKSGFCKVKGKDCFFIDKHLKQAKKMEVLAEYLVQQQLDTIYIIPAVRDYLDEFKPKIKVGHLRDTSPEMDDDTN